MIDGRVFCLYSSAVYSLIPAFVITTQGFNPLIYKQAGYIPLSSLLSI